MRGFFGMVLRMLLPPVCLSAFLTAAWAGEASLARDAAQKLAAAYPDAHIFLEDGADGLYLRVENSRLFFSPWSGCPTAAPEQREDAPLCAIFAQAYPSGAGGRDPVPGCDPGRIRNEAFLKLLYGKNAAEVTRELSAVMLAGRKVLFSKRQGAAAAMARVAARLERLLRDQPEMRAYISPAAGGYSRRTIKGSQRLSPHAFGIAVDLNAANGPYWRWFTSDSAKAVERVRRDYPQAIVDAFEAEGFIWGGKWHSFDFMHFEYRPELAPPDGERLLP